MASNNNDTEKAVGPPSYADITKQRRLPQEHDDVNKEDKTCDQPQSTSNISNQAQNKESQFEVNAIETNVEVQRSPSPKPEPKPRVVLKRLSSSAQDNVSVPKVNCPEKIILCVDHSSKMFTEHFRRTKPAIKHSSVMQVLNGAIRQFVMTKSTIDKRHEFSLFMLNDDAQLISDFSTLGNDVMFMMQDISNTPKVGKHSDIDAQCSVNISQLFDQIEKHVTLPVVKNPSQVAPSYVVRLIFVYGRSGSKLEFLNGQESFQKLMKSPYFFVDSVYIHDEPTEENLVTEIFTSLCQLDANGSSYVLEVGLEGSMSLLYNAMAKLLAHPLQRQRQPTNFTYEIHNQE